MKTFIIFDNDQFQPYMFRAENVDDLPKLFLKMLEEAADGDLDVLENLNLKDIERQFKDDEISVECITEYESQGQTVVTLFV